MNSEFLPDASIGTRAAMLAATGLLLAGCTAAPDVTPGPHHSATQSEHVYQLPPTGPENAPCAEPKPDDPHIKEKARNCERMQAAGTIAMVSFDADPTRFEAIERVIPPKISAATGGKAHLTPTTFAASPTAKTILKHYEKVNKKGEPCVDTGGHGVPLPAKIADATMPELHKYDLVLAVTKEPACGPQAGQTTGRLVNAYVGKAGGNLDEAEAVALHEVGHGEAMGHSGRAGVPPPGHQVPQDIMNFGYAMGKPMDLKAYLNGSNGKVMFQEYAYGTNIMGTSSSLKYVMPSPVQEALLDWPKTVLKDDPSIKPVGPKPLKLTVEDAANNKIAGIHLDPPAEIANVANASVDHPATRKFDELLMTPYTFGPNEQAAGGESYITGVDLTLVESSSHATVDLGVLQMMHGDSASTEISYGDQHVELDISREIATLKTVPDAH